MSPTSLASGPWRNGPGPRRPWRGCSWDEDFVASTNSGFGYDLGYLLLKQFYERASSRSVFPAQVTTPLDSVLSIGNTTGGDARRALFLYNNPEQYGITFALPDSAMPVKSVWLGVEAQMDFGVIGSTSGPFDWQGSGRPFSLRLASDDESVVVELTTASVTQDPTGAPCNGVITGPHNSYTIATTVDGTALVAQQPIDVIDPTVMLPSGFTGIPPWIALYASLATPGALHVEWWNNAYCFQRTIFDLTGPAGDVGFARASLSITSPYGPSGHAIGDDARSLVVNRFARVCAPLATDPFGLL